MAEKQVIEIDIDSLQANPLQPRGLITPESLVDLVDSIKEHGILEPLVIAKTPAGFQIIAGERRWRAAKIVGLKTVPAIIKETSPQGMLEMALVENVQREDLNPLERAQAFVRLMKEFGLTNQEICKRIGKSPAYISNSIKLLSLPDALKDGLLSSLITEGHARALAAITEPKLMVEAYKMILRDGGSVRHAEDIARRIKKKIGFHPSEKVLRSSPPLLVSDEIDKIRDDILEALGGNEKAIVKITRSRVATKIFIALKGSLIETEDNLQRVYNGVVKPILPGGQ
jgi:ParB family chromosome partitioning protein